MGILGRPPARAPINTADIPDGIITSAKIGADAIDGTKLADNAVDSEHITAAGIDTAHLGNLQVTAAKVASDVATQSELDAKDIPGISSSGSAATDLVTIAGNLAVDGSYAKIPAVTTTQRDALTPAVGMLIYNSTIGLLQQRDASGWASIAAPPVYTSSNINNFEETDSTQTLVISGSNFDATATAKLVDNNGVSKTPTTSTRNSSTQITIVYSGGDILPISTAEPLDIVVTNGSGLSVTVDNAINIDARPVWQSPATGALTDQTYTEDTAISTLNFVATDAETTPTYSISSGAIPSGLALSSAGALTGTPNVGHLDPGITQVHNFNVRADDTTGNTTDRSFALTRNSAISSTNMVYHFKATDYSGSAGNVTDGTDLTSCFTSASTASTSAECEFGTIQYVTNNSHAPGGDCFTLSNNGAIKVEQSSTANYNTHYNTPSSTTIMLWVDWDGSSRQGFFTRYGDGAPTDGSISHFNHMFDSYTQVHHNAGGVGLGAGNRTGNSTAPYNWATGETSQWVFWVITYAVSDGYWRRYTDGVSWNTENAGTNSGHGFRGPSTNGTYYNNTTPHMLGARADGVEKMIGKIAEARYYTRALSAAEILAEWNATKGSYSRS